MQVPVAPAPAELPPIAPPDPGLFTPLPPLSSLAGRTVTELAGAAPIDVEVRYKVEVDGLAATGQQANWRASSTLYRGQSDRLTLLDLGSRVRTDKALLTGLLSQEGWFDTSVTETITTTPTGQNGLDTALVKLTVAPGPRFHWSEIAVDAAPPGRPDLVEGFGLMPGMPIRLLEVEQAEAAYQLALANAGYPFAELGPRDIVIDSETATGTYLLTGIVGPAAVFGRIRLEGYQPFDVDHAEVIARFSEGEAWSATRVDDFRRALVATRLISNLSVSPENTGEVDADGRAIADVVVRGEEAPRRSLQGEVGYSTNEGIRTEARWQNRNLWRPEGTFTASAVIGTLEQGVSATMLKSNFGRRDRFLRLEAAFLNQQDPAFNATSFGLTGAIGRASTPIWQKKWVWETGLAILQSSEENKSAVAGALGNRQSYTIFGAPTSGGLDLTDDLLNPTRGLRAGLRVSPEGAFANSDLNAYVRLQGDVSVYREMTESLVLAARLRLGSIVGTETSNIAPSRRLYAGGGGSIRGYSFQGVGPSVTEPDGDVVPTGGRGLFEASAEARYRFGDFGIVAFVDSGQLVDGVRPEVDGLRFGAGLGVRYFTSFGPLRLDLARAIDRRPQDPQVVLYISIGQAF
jgi:translocation and assembly module TamA